MSQSRNTSLSGDRCRIPSEHYSDADHICDATGSNERSDICVKLLTASDKARVPVQHAQRCLGSVSLMAAIRLRSEMGSKTIEHRHER